MVHKPAFYADLLRQKIQHYGVQCWLVNTGWVGGPYGVGKRISIRHTRNLLDAALEGALNGVEYYIDPVFGFEIPTRCPEVPEDVLYPARAWHNQDEYWKRYKQLASRFIDNMKKFEIDTQKDIIAAGPKI